MPDGTKLRKPAPILATLRRHLGSIKEIMGPGALDALSPTN